VGEFDNVLPTVESVVGGRLADTLTGDDDDNTLDGGRGEDLITGDAGVDRLEGGDGNDVIDAQDREGDSVVCGDGDDLVLIDRRGDRPVECETESKRGDTRPRARRDAILDISAPYGLRLEERGRWFDLATSIRMPLGGIVDPKEGEVRLTTATGRRRRSSVLLRGDSFAVTQSGRRAPRTIVRIAERPTGCGRRARAKSARRSTDGLHWAGVARGSKGYRVKGHYSTGAPRGTKFTTEERCDGTLTTVEEGTVRVHDLTRDRWKIVRPGRPYLAPAGRRNRERAGR
jgi:hypothetical protein